MTFQEIKELDKDLDDLESCEGFYTYLKSLAEKIGSWGIDLLFIYLLYSWLKKVHEYKKIYPQKLDEWKRSWICKKCGHIFVKDYLE